MKRMIHVAKGTVCPLCPNHFDDEKDFVWSNLLKAPICWPCTYEIFNGFIGFDEAPTTDQYNCADSMKKIEKLTGMTFLQAKIIFLKEIIEENEAYLYYEKKMIDENVSREESFKDFEKRICEFKSEMERTAMIMSDGAVKR